MLWHRIFRNNCKLTHPTSNKNYSLLLLGDRASHAYIITLRKHDAKIVGEAPVDCDPDDLESTRAETYGMVAIHTLLNVLCENFEIACREIEVYCDNVDALGENEPNTCILSYPRFFRPNFDLKTLL